MKFPRLDRSASLPTRLTLWHGLVVALVLIAFTVTVYLLLSRGLRNEIDKSLADRAQQVNNSIRPAPGRGGMPSSRVEIPLPDTFASADTFVQVVNLDGEIIGASDNLGGAELPFPEEGIQSILGGLTRYANADLEGEAIRVYSAPIVADEDTVGMIQVASSLNRVDAALSELRFIAAGGLIVALIASGFIVWLTANAALRPLENVISTAEAIGTSGDLSRRVATWSKGDEVGRLANAFNWMLNRLESSSEALRSAYERVEASLTAQRRFVADASHELRTPLTTIRSNAGLLSQYPDVTPEDRQASLAQISQEAERMSRLVQSLLTLARADAGQALAKAPVALAPLVEDVSAQAKMLRPGQHTINTEIKQTPVVSGDPDALRQLSLILLDNAVKSTPAGGRIDFRLEQVNGTARLTVQDTGIGIADEDLPHIFERFYRADRSRQAGGTGLGLSIAKWIAEQHNGSIAVASTPSKGSTFTVTLPLG